MTEPRILLSIQYLRGMAAVAVAAFHTGWTHTDLGAAGVDVFFVISGFIMAHVSRREVTPSVFLRARLLRVVPLYWLMTLLVAVSATRVVTVEHLLQSLLFWPHVGPDGREWPVLIQGWSLPFEMGFYMLFAIALLMPWLKREIMTAALLALVALGVVIHPAHPGGAAATSPILLEFLAGLWLHRAWDRGWLRHAAPALVVGGAAFGVQVMIPISGSWHWFSWGVPATLVVAGALALEGAGHLRRVPGLRQIGDASYALYLTHMLLFSVLRPVLTPLPAVAAVMVCVTASIVVALLVHRGIEKPLARWLSGKLEQFLIKRHQEPIRRIASR